MLARALAQQTELTSRLLSGPSTAGVGGGDAVLSAMLGSSHGLSGTEADLERPMTGAKGAAAMELWRQLVREQPEVVIRRPRGNMREALFAGPEPLGSEEEDRHRCSLRQYFQSVVCVDKARGLGYMLWLLCTVADLLHQGATSQAEALVLLGICAGEQASLDEGRWTLAWMFTHLPEPDWGRVGRRPNASVLRPFSRLLPPAWAAAASAFVRDMSALSELKKKARSEGKGAGKGPSEE